MFGIIAPKLMGDQEQNFDQAVPISRSLKEAKTILLFVQFENLQQTLLHVQNAHFIFSRFFDLT